jgi:hypothetical protein
VPPIESLTNPEVRALAVRARDFVEAHAWCAHRARDEQRHALGLNPTSHDTS